MSENSNQSKGGLAHNAVTFFASYYTALEIIHDPLERLAAYETIVRYGLYEEEPKKEEVPEIVQMAFALVKPTLDRSIARAEAGRVGGQNSGASRRAAAAGNKVSSGKRTGVKQQDTQTDAYAEDAPRVEGSVLKAVPKPQTVQAAAVTEEEAVAYFTKRFTTDSGKIDQVRAAVVKTSPEVLMYVLCQAEKNNSPRWVYCKGIMDNLAERGVRTVDEAVRLGLVES